jgi:fatty acid desaturase
MRYKVLAIRVILGVFFAFLLGRWFFPNSRPVLIVGIALMLVFFAYVLESVHKRGDRS